MGIILSALAAAGDEGVRSLDSNIKQIHLQELEAQRSDLELQKAINIAKFNTTVADQQRKELASRIAIQPGQSEAIIARNMAVQDASRAALSTGTSIPADLPPIDPASYQPTGSQLYQQQIDNAMKSGDYAVAAELAKVRKESIVATAYGSTSKSLADLDAFGQPVLVDDNSIGRTESSAANARARQTAADAQTVKATAAVTTSEANRTKANRPAGGGTNDQVLTALQKVASDSRTRLDTLTRVANTNPPLPGHLDPGAPALLKAQQEYDAARKAVQDRLTEKATAAAAGAGSKNYSDLWGAGK